MNSNDKSNEMEHLFRLQKKYFDNGHTASIGNRIANLKKLRSVIQKSEIELSRALNIDLNKSEFESYASEIGFVLEEIRYHIKNLNGWVKRQYTSTPISNFPATSYTISEPLGNVLIIAPWNYPVQLLLTPLIGAISAGNTAILKPSEISSATSSVLEKIINDNFEPDFLRVIEGDAATTQSLLKLDFNHIFFTGSSEVGRIIMQAAADRLIPITLELSGKSPCIVDKDINLKLAAKRIVWGKLINSGQSCIAPDYILVNAQIKDEFIDEIKKSFIGFYGEDASLNNDYPRIISKANVERLASLIENTDILYGGSYDADSRYFEPTIINDANMDMPIMQQEIFGPIIPIISYDDIDDAISKIKSLPKPLALYIFTNCRRKQNHILENTSAGGVTINDTMMHIANNKIPFGGVGNSGIGKYHGKYSFDIFSNQKSVVNKGTWLDIPIRYAPYTKSKLRIIRWLMR